MRRKEKYPDTKYFKYYNANPKGKIGGDCVIRSISTALNQTWEETIRELTELGIKLGYVLNDKHTYEKYLEAKGFVKQKQPRKTNNKKYTGKEFVKLNKDAVVIAHIGGHHIVCIKENKIFDIWDCSDSCIGNYWIINKENK